VVEHKSENLNVGHGHVFPRPDGMKARCGGPSLCSQCARDYARYAREKDACGRKEQEALNDHIANTTGAKP